MTLKEKPTVELYQLLKANKANAAAAIKKCCAILVELDSRGENVAAHTRGLYKEFRAIHAGTLSVNAAVNLAGAQHLIAKIQDLPLKEQDAAVKSRVVVADYSPGGKPVPVEKDFRLLNRREADLVFSESGRRSYKEQARVLRARRPQDVRRGTNKHNIRADTDTGEIVFGNVRIKPALLVPALRALGFKLVRRIDITPPTD